MQADLKQQKQQNKTTEKRCCQENPVPAGLLVPARQFCWKTALPAWREVDS